MGRAHRTAERRTFGLGESAACPYNDVSRQGRGFRARAELQARETTSRWPHVLRSQRKVFEVAQDLVSRSRSIRLRWVRGCVKLQDALHPFHFAPAHRFFQRVAWTETVLNVVDQTGCKTSDSFLGGLVKAIPLFVK